MTDDLKDRAEPAPESPSIRCPRCGLRSYNPNDVQHRYCGNCHAFHDDLDNQIDCRKLSPSTIERIRVAAIRKFGRPLDEIDYAKLSDEAMGRLLAEAERTGETVYEVIDRILRKWDA